MSSPNSLITARFAPSSVASRDAGIVDEDRGHAPIWRAICFAIAIQSSRMVKSSEALACAASRISFAVLFSRIAVAVEQTTRARLAASRRADRTAEADPAR